MTIVWIFCVIGVGACVSGLLKLVTGWRASDEQTYPAGNCGQVAEVRGRG